MSDEFDFGGNDVEEVEERIGGDWSTDDSNIYLKGITQAWLTQSSKGAYAMNLNTKDKEGNERSYQFYFTNRAGQVYYTKNGKKRHLPGYTLLNAICTLTCGKSAKDVLSKGKLKVINLMDWESRTEVPTEVKTFPQLCKKAILFGIIKKVDNRYKNGKPTNEKREQNEISMVFEKGTKLTVTEKARGDTEPKLHGEWLKRWEGNIDDQFVQVEEAVDAGDNPFDADYDTDASSGFTDTATTDDADDDDDMFA